MDEQKIKSIYDAYSSGKMPDDVAAEYEADVKSGAMEAPQGAILSRNLSGNAEATKIKPRTSVFNAYFSGKMDAEASRQLERDAADGIIELPEGVAVSEYHDPIAGNFPKLERDTTIKEEIIGAGEAALTTATGATTGAVGHIAGVLSGLYEALSSGEYGTREGAEMVKKASEDLARKYTYEPKTEVGKERVEDVAAVLEPLAAIGPMAGEVEIAARAARKPQATRAGTVKREMVKEAEAVGIEPMTTDVFKPKTFVGKVWQAVGERVPVFGSGVKRAAQYEQRESAIKSFLSDYGAMGNDKILSDVMKSLSDKRSFEIQKYSGLKGEVFSKLDDMGSMPVSNAVKEIDSSIKKFEGLKISKKDDLIAELNDFKQAIQDQPISNVEELRKILGESFKQEGLASVRDIGEKAYRAIYRELNKDYEQFIKDKGGQKDYNKWKIANKNLSNMQGELNKTVLKSALNTGAETPEKVGQLLFSQKPSDIASLYKNLDASGKANARIAILSEAFKKAGGADDFTPAKFMNQIKRLSPSTKMFFKGDDKKALDGLMKALRLTKHADIAGVKPTTGAELTTFATPSILTYFMGNDPVTGLAATAGVGVIARTYESKVIRDSLISLANAPKPQEIPITIGILSAIQAQIDKEEETK